MLTAYLWCLKCDIRQDNKIELCLIEDIISKSISWFQHYFCIKPLHKLLYVNILVYLLMLGVHYVKVTASMIIDKLN